MGVKVTNNAYGTLSAGIASGDTTITLDGGQGARFPTLGAGDYFYGTLVDTSNNIEVVKVTARSTDSMTVVRGQDNTAARAYVIGDRFELRPTAALFEDLADSATITAVSDQANTSTGYLALPAGTTAQRPGSPTAGMIRHNTDLGLVETYDGSGWVAIGDQTNSYDIDVLVVGGGGSGGNAAGTNYGGGGGAGGLVWKTLINVDMGSSKTIVVGAGAAAKTSSGNGNKGNNSTALGLTALGGGAGGVQDTPDNQTLQSGGSGGGGGYPSGGAGPGGSGLQPSQSGDSGAYGFGNNGGSGNTSPNGGGGGGGAGAVGQSNSPCNGGAGQDFSAYFSTSLGDSGWFAGGGGGSNQAGYPTPAGGQGGGGSGSVYNTSSSTAGDANTGGGGGAGTAGKNTGQAGGSGVVIIRYLGSQRGTGGTVTTHSGYTIHTFTSSGTFTA